MEKKNSLEKKLSPVQVLSLALGCIIGWGAFVMPGNTFLPSAGPLGTVLAMLIASVIMIIISINYSYMIKKFPVAGGEFTYTQNAFGNNHAVFCAWFLSLSYLSIVPLNGTALALIGRSLLSNLFQFGFHYQVAGYDVYLGEVVLAVCVLVLFAQLSIRGVKLAGVFQTVLVFALVGGVLIITFAAIKSPYISFEKLNPLFYSKKGSSLSGILSVVAIAPWAFVGFDTIPQAAEELNFSSKKTKVIMVLSILFGAFVYVDLNIITAIAIPQHYGTWLDYIDDLANLDGIVALPTFNAANLLMGKVGLWVLGVAVLGAVLSGIMGFYMAASRLLYSMSRQDILPEWFGRLHPKYNTPSNSIIFIMIVSIIAPFLGRTALGWIVDMASIGAAIGYGYTSAAAAKYAKKECNKKMMVMGIIGTLMGIIFCILLLVPIPGLDSSLGRESYICLFIWLLAGFVLYFAKKKRTE